MNPVSRDRSGQAPWRSYSGLASPGPRTCPPWRFVSMLRSGPVLLLRPASAESASQCPRRAQDWFHGSLDLAQLDLRYRKLKRQERKGEIEEERKEAREGEGMRGANAPDTAPDGLGPPALALGRTIQGSQLP